MNTFPVGPQAVDRASALASPCDSPILTRLPEAYLNAPVLVDIQTSLLRSTITLLTSWPESSSPASSPSFVILCTPRAVPSHIIPCPSSAIERTSSPAKAAYDEPATDDLKSVPLNRATPLSVPNHINPSLSWNIARIFFDGRLGTVYR